MKLKMKYAVGMRDELEEVLGCPVRAGRRSIPAR